MAEERSRFVPVLRSELARRLLDEREDDEAFAHAAALLHHVLRYEADGLAERLRASYTPFDPDPLAPSLVDGAGREAAFLSCAEQVLDDANFRRLSDDGLQAAFRQKSLFQVLAEVDLDEYDILRIYVRGRSSRDEQVRGWSTLWRWRTRRLELYDRLVVILRLKPEALTTDVPMRVVGMEPGKIYLKSFKNIPDADVEMVLPNAHLRLRPLDRVLVGGPLLAGVGWTVFQSVSVLAAIAAGSFALSLEEPLLRATGGVLLVLAGYLWRTHAKIKTRRLEYLKTLSQGLYFRNLANNRSVLEQLLMLAHDEEEKEALLAYHFLSLDGPAPADDLDRRAEAWVLDLTGREADFDVHDGLARLKDLGLAHPADGLWTAVAPEEAARILDARWDGAFGSRPP